MSERSQNRRKSSSKKHQSLVKEQLRQSGRHARQAIDEDEHREKEALEVLPNPSKVPTHTEVGAYSKHKRDQGSTVLPGTRKHNESESGDRKLYDDEVRLALTKLPTNRRQDTNVPLISESEEAENEDPSSSSNDEDVYFAGPQKFSREGHKGKVKKDSPLMLLEHDPQSKHGGASRFQF